MLVSVFSVCVVFFIAFLNGIVSAAIGGINNECIFHRVHLFIFEIVHAILRKHIQKTKAKKRKKETKHPVQLKRGFPNLFDLLRRWIVTPNHARTIFFNEMPIYFGCTFN